MSPPVHYRRVPGFGSTISPGVLTHTARRPSTQVLTPTARHPPARFPGPSQGVEKRKIGLYQTCGLLYNMPSGSRPVAPPDIGSLRVGPENLTHYLTSVCQFSKFREDGEWQQTDGSRRAGLIFCTRSICSRHRPTSKSFCPRRQQQRSTQKRT